MRWLKHLSDAHTDEKMAMLRAEAGFEGYGFYWFILESIAKHVDEEKGKTSLTYPIKFWASFAGVSTRNLRNLVETCAKLKLFTADFFENSLTIDCPNILKYRDEWSRKKSKNSGAAPDKLRCKDSDTDTESEYIPATSETDVPEAAVCSEREGEKQTPITANQTAGPRQKTGRPNACPAETWAHYLKISRGFHMDKSNQLGARAPFTDEKVLSGARALDTLIRVRGRPEDEVLAVLGWSIDDPFWSTNLRSIKALLKTSNGNGELKYSNVLTAMTRDLERKAERSMAANG